jgi:hypothetical protein
LSILIPSNVSSIGNLAFIGCDNLFIYAEVTTIPVGWHSEWKPTAVPVIFDVLSRNPRDLYADVLVEGVQLSWSIPELEFLEILHGYVVYRDGNDISGIISELDFIDGTALSGVMYEYHVVSVFTTENQSLPSNNINVIAGMSDISTILVRDNFTSLPIYENYFVRVQGVALNNHGVISDHRNDFMIQQSTSFIRVFSTEIDQYEIDSVNAVKGDTYIVSGQLRLIGSALHIIPTTNIVHIPVEEADEEYVPPVPPEDNINQISYFINPVNSENYIGSLIGISYLYRWDDPSNPWPSSTSSIRSTHSVILTDETDTFFILLRLPSNSELIDNEPDWPMAIIGLFYENDDPEIDISHQIILLSDDGIQETIDSGGQLSLVLSSFTASIIGITSTSPSVNIQWTTSSESNLTGFHIFRQTEGVIGTEQLTQSLIPATNTSLIQDYEFTDADVVRGVEYWYWLQSSSNDGTFQFHEIGLHVFIPLEGIVELPQLTTMNNVYPNPVRSDAHFEVSVKAGETARLRIFNIRGQIVKEFVDIPEGENKFTWDRRDSTGRDVSSGVYFYQLSSPSVHSVRRMVVVK